MPRIYATLLRNSVRESFADYAQYQAVETGWYRIPCVGGGVNLTVYDLNGAVRRNWYYLWGDVEGGPVTAPITGGGSARVNLGAISYANAGNPYTVLDVHLEVQDILCWSYTGIAGPVVEIQYMGPERPVERSIIV